jgi:2-oxoisovalerate dehydrogenase E2 component (dihydrolipoyl transacylase)
MGRYVFKLPDIGEGTAEAELVAWHVAIGDRVKEEQTIVDVMTEKATVEIPAPVSGTVIELAGQPGEMLAVGSEIIVFEVEGSGNADALATLSKAQPATAKVVSPRTPPPAEATGPEPADKTTAAPARFEPAAAPSPSPAPTRGDGKSAALKPGFATRTPGEKPIASPAVRGRAWELGVQLQFVGGSGPGGRITHDDLDRYVASGGSIPTIVGARPVLARKEGVDEIKVIGLRRKIAEKMQEAKRRIPHFSYIEEVDVTALEELRAHLNATKRTEQPRLTLLPFLMRAMVRSLVDIPQINARFDDDAGVVHRHQAVHMGIATQTPNGLVVTVVRHAEALDIWDAASELIRLANAAREGKATREELSGSTITITSLGTLGAVATTPVINHPEVAIVGVNKMAERPMVRDGQIVIRKMMNLSSSFDHRVVDGVDAAEFVQRVRGFLEQPATLFMD